MKSAYGRSVPPETIELTHVESGSPMGELLRRYWQPLCTSDEVRDLPKRVRILCEDLVVFRTASGDVGCLELHCSHRGTSLEYGRIEENGIRCCYHGWLYAPSGLVTEMPCEPAGYCERRNIEHPAYPVREIGGLIFAYMGPPGTEPQFPMFDVIDRPGVVLRGMRIWEDYAIGYVRDCNWLQHYENIMDPYHVLMLHQNISGDQFESAMMLGTTSIAFEDTPLGIRYKMEKELPNGNRYIRCSECVLPNIALIPNIRESGDAPKFEERCSDLTWVVPIDNEHVTALSMVAWPLENGAPRHDWRPDTDTVSDARPGSFTARPYEQKQRRPDDLEAQESQRPIAVHKLEHLVSSDTGVARLRKLLRLQLQAIDEGRDPINVVRDESRNHRIETSAYNTVLAPAQGVTIS